VIAGDKFTLYTGLLALALNIAAALIVQVFLRSSAQAPVARRA
jgi:hypothetical protein